MAIFAELNTSGQSNTARTLTASVRVPASQLDSTLPSCEKLGELDEEKQGGEEVSRQYVDLKARLENGHNTEKSLTELLAKRTDRLKDVLGCRNASSPAHGEEVERMEAEQRNLQQLVNYASIEVNLREEYKPAWNLAPPAAGTRMRNALVDGYHAVVENGLALVLLCFGRDLAFFFGLLLLFSLCAGHGENLAKSSHKSSRSQGLSDGCLSCSRWKRAPATIKGARHNPSAPGFLERNRLIFSQDHPHRSALGKDRKSARLPPPPQEG